MLAAPQAEQLLESFFAQWLHLANLETVQPDYHYFPSFDEPLRRSMRQETDLLLRWLFRSDRSLAGAFTQAPTMWSMRASKPTTASTKRGERSMRSRGGIKWTASRRAKAGCSPTAAS